MKLLNYLTIGLFLFGSPLLAQQDAACFQRHLQDAIAVNQSRLAPYMMLSHGQSLLVSKALIASERAGMLFARYFDRRARSYQKAGIGLFCEDFVSMDAIQPMVQQRLAGFDPSQVPHPQVMRSQQQLRFLLDQRLYADMLAFIRHELDEFRTWPQAHCLYRHTLESIGRAVSLIPHYRELAALKGLNSPESLSQRFIRLQIETLLVSHVIDRLALGVQSQGVPILCYDVPAIDFAGDGGERRGFASP